MIQLSDYLKEHISAEREFETIAALQGEVFRQHKNRRTIRAQIGGRAYFVKTHGPTGWREILKNALRGRWPVLTAHPEWRAIKRLEALNIPTVHAVGYGMTGRFPNRLHSFIITEALVGMIHLDELAQRLSRLRLRDRTILQRLLIRELARIARVLHSNGLNHRDFYLCHFLIRDRDWQRWSREDELMIHVIDLHRMQIRHRTPQRWAIKDISGLLFSALDCGLTSRDYLRFLSEYWDCPWRERWVETRWWRRTVLRRAIKLYRSEHGKSPRLPGALASFA